MGHTDTYERAQMLITKIHKGLRDWETNADVSPINQASIATELQTLNRYISQYKQDINSETNEKSAQKLKYVAYKMTDEHQILQNRFNAVKQFYQNQKDEAAKNELFQRTDGTRTKAAGSAKYANDNSFYERSEIEIDGYIDQGLAALDSLKKQRAGLKNAHRNVLDSRDTLGLSDRVIRFINRRNAQDKLIMFAGMAITVVIVYYIIKYFS